MTGLRHRLEAALFAVLVQAARFLPRRLLLGLGSVLGDLGYLLDRRHRRIGLENLTRALGDELSPADRQRVLRDCWRHFGRITLDTLCFPRFGPADVNRLIRYEGLEHLREAYAKKKGVLVFTAHFGHWELSGLMQGYLGLPLALVARPLDNPYLERMLAGVRGLSGNRIVHKRNAVREMLKALQAGIGVAIVIDQDARGSGVFVPFFGRPASTTPTLALLALRTEAAVLPCFSIPQRDGTYRAIYEPALEIRSTGDREADVLRLTAECTAIIERWVRQYPEFWLWMHRRWKTQPPPNGTAANDPD
jgi:KDO2-lipid IV(A) lauroyltransferase